MQKDRKKEKKKEKKRKGEKNRKENEVILYQMQQVGMEVEKLIYSIVLI